jgi:uncharacterized protein
MLSLAKKIETPVAPRPMPMLSTALTVEVLKSGQEIEALEFLAGRPVHTVYIAGLIRDNGLHSKYNRGDFYGCRNAEGQLEGVALIGHYTAIEARSEAALQHFARLARNCSLTHVVVGESDDIDRFWSYYASPGQSPRLACRELLMEQRWPIAVRERVEGLRLATLEDLPLIMAPQAEMAFEESGVNPLEVDPEGFRGRCARRIELGRTWVLIEDGRLIFKAEIMADTSEAIYLEGIYVNPEVRRQGYGLRCMSQLGQSLLKRTGSLCLLVNERNQRAQGFYNRAGYKLLDYYDTVYLPRNSSLERVS